MIWSRFGSNFLSSKWNPSPVTSSSVVNLIVAFPPLTKSVSKPSFLIVANDEVIFGGSFLPFPADFRLLEGEFDPQKTFLSPLPSTTVTLSYEQ